MKIVAVFFLLGLAILFVRQLTKPKPGGRGKPKTVPIKKRKEPPKKAAAIPPSRKTKTAPRLSLEEVKTIKHRTIMQQVAFQDPNKIVALIKMALKEKNFL